MRVGNKGRVVFPAEIRARHGWDEGTVLITIEQPDGGVLVLSREEALARIREQVAGRDIVQELIDERRAEAAREDAGIS